MGSVPVTFRTGDVLNVMRYDCVGFNFNNMMVDFGG